MAGRIRQIVELLEQRHSPFLVSRLILMTGVRVREFTSDSPDDPTVLRKLEKALRTLVSESDMKVFEPLLTVDPSGTATARGGLK